MAVTLTLFNVAIQLAERLVIRDDVITACNGSKSYRWTDFKYGDKWRRCGTVCEWVKTLEGRICVEVFCVDLRTNSDYFLIQH